MAATEIKVSWTCDFTGRLFSRTMVSNQTKFIHLQISTTIKATVQQYRNVYIGGQHREQSSCTKSLPPEIHTHTTSERESGIYNKNEINTVHKVITLSLQTVVMRN